MAAAFEKFGQNRDSRSRNRSNERYNNRRGSNDSYSRSPSRSTNRDNYRRNYSPYRGNSGDRYSRYDNRRGRDDYRGRRDRSNSGDRNYRPRNNSGTRYPSNNRSPPKRCGFCNRTGHPIENCWDFQEYFKKLGRQITKTRGNGSRDKMLMKKQMIKLLLCTQ